MSHSHWPSSHPFSKTRRHDIPRAECDATWTEYLHYHVGSRCDMREEPGYVRPRCSLMNRDRPSDDARAKLVASWQDDFAAFADKEATRMADGGPPV